MNVGILLKYYRKLRFLTQEELASGAGVNEKYYGRIERGESIPTIEVLFKICEAMSVEATQVCFALRKEEAYKYLLMDKRDNLLDGDYIKEIPPRFVAEVSLNGLTHLVYTGTNSKLSNYVELEGQKVLLQKTIKQSKYSFSLFALDKGDMYLMLNSNIINNVFEELYYIGALKGYTIYGIGLPERTINNYKCDFFFPEENLLVENKTLMCKESKIIYPLESSEHIKKQLKSIRDVLRSGYKVKYNLFILFPWINMLSWAEDIKDLIKETQSMGMQILLYYVYYESNILKVQAAELREKEENLFDIIFL
ncbi:MAG: helix-turn-helix domain-containing protein [Tyzzerella sp.]|nr:helix-turn-helix domain-containing protein [Tyzzerella sp.]